MKEIIMMLMSQGIEAEKVKSRLIMILDKYEIGDRCTEVSVVSEDDIAKYLKMFLINKKVSGRTERTLQHYNAELKRFFCYIQKSPIDVTSDDIKIYLATKEIRDGISKVYLKNISRVLSSFYQWMQKEEYIIKNPMNKVDEIKLPKVKKEAFTEEQIEKLRLAIGDDIRVMCMFELLLSTWCRVSELAQIKLKEISEDCGTVLIHGKGSKDRKCYINERAKIYLKKYLEERSDENEYLLPNCRIGVNSSSYISNECKKRKLKQNNWWKSKDLVGTGHIDKSVIESLLRKLGKRANVEKVHPHRFRRTGATFA